MKLVILDRDGVINEDSDEYVKSHHEWRAIPGSLEAIARLNQNGYRVVVATNQSGIGRGLFDTNALNAMHAKMLRALATVGGKIDAVFFCPHTPEDNCDCRKPKPGLFQQIAHRFGVALADTTMIGDSHRDLEAGRAAGCEIMLVRTGKGADVEKEGRAPPGTLVFDDLAGAVAHLVRRAEAA
ncbi:MAG: D-glycero-beta-D-manno-heptose 1,7-bisphosphate 7-phosphatase [Burkholderiaceae bacterium]|jgi:D-glycero-D-manno-heptose 1,7-bisphosphate phosphatase